MQQLTPKKEMFKDLQAKHQSIIIKTSQKGYKISQRTTKTKKEKKIIVVTTVFLINTIQILYQKKKKKYFILQNLIYQLISHLILYQFVQIL